MSRQAKMAARDGWELDLFSTMLSRKHSWHRCHGKLRLVRKRKVARQGR